MDFMRRLTDYLRRLLPSSTETSEDDLRQLRRAFRARYHTFRRLLDANTEVLQIITDLETSLEGSSPFGMPYVRARCTLVATRAWQMARRLEELAPGKYTGLFDSFQAIQERISPFVSQRRMDRDTPLVLPLDEIVAGSAAVVGAKTANLGEMRNRVGLRVPEGFVVTTSGYRKFIENEGLETRIERLQQAVEERDHQGLAEASRAIRELILAAEVPQVLAASILEAYDRLARATHAVPAVAVRSSALGEDLAGASVAGQYHSELNVRRETLLEAYREVVASKYGLPAMTYRLQRGLPDQQVDMCVGVFVMVDAVAGGVLYSHNPLDRSDNSIIVTSAWGLPKPVVEGEVPSDLFVVARGEQPEIVRREVADKPLKFVSHARRGVCGLETTGRERAQPSLTDGQVHELARAAIRLEAHYGAPQDVEWAIDRDGRFVALQSRELRLSRPAAPRPKAGGLPWGKVLADGGTPVSRGAASGPVVVVETEVDALEFPQGGILVTVQPLPRLANLLSRAVAVIAEYGSVAGHLANVAREYRVPALFAVRGAVERLRGQGTVTVDADGKRVYAGRIEALLDRPEEPENPLEGNPAYEALRSASRHIIPLTLLDPDAKEFRPEQCTTLHDITRFCHEKAVMEMFHFGRDNRFPARTAKQLHCDVPMLWWVLDLDDGFTEDVSGRHVRLDQVASVPMLALWEGITAIPWDGPPPLDGKGFMSVMFGATTNTELTMSLPTGYTEKSYFMISRDFCSLSSRLGAHFAIIEALVSVRTSGNYASFRFKGGAADFDRRLRRVLLLKEVLDEYGFHAEVQQDKLTARLEGQEMRFMQSRLKILGYLSIHARQLDMVMARQASVDHYRAKFHRDIQSILAAEEASRTAPS